MDRSPLCTKEIYPEDDQIEKLLDKVYPVYKSFLETLAREFEDLTPAWIYYNDVKYWLLKTTQKKKTVFWLTIWEGYFKITLYFAEQLGNEIQLLDIDESIKEQYRLIKRSGKTNPIILDIKYEKQLKDAFTLIRHKSG